jgi:thiol:disulfide interchange protein
MQRRNKEMVRIWFFILFILSGLQGFGQLPETVKWSFSSKKVSENTYDLILTAKIEKDWHVYSQHIADGGPVATAVTVNKNDAAYTLIGAVKEKGKAIKINDPGFDNMEVIYYKNEVSFIQRVKTLTKVESIEGKVYFETCNDKKCQPPVEVPFKIVLGKSGAVSSIPSGKKDDKSAKDQNPKDVLQTTASSKTGTIQWSTSLRNIKGKLYELKLTATISKGFHLNAADEKKPSGCKAPVLTFNPQDSVKMMGGLISDDKTVLVKEQDGSSYPAYENSAVFRQNIELPKQSKQIKGTVVYNACNEQECVPSEQSDFTIDVPREKILTSHGNESLSFIFWICFLGGIAALMTPCVFPMIPLTVSFFTKQSDKKSKGISSALLFGASIMVIYVGLGLLITVLFGPNALNDLASNVYTNLAFFVIFSIFAFSFLGAFDITLPTSWANKTDAKAEKGGVVGIFFIALTLTIVSFSCTSLVIGNLLILAAKGGGYTGPAVGMIGFSLAWAIPFTIFAMFPSLMQKLPKSGGWLNAIKVTLGFIELALALKFLSTADITYHWGFLKREYFLALWIIIFGMLGFYLLGKIKLSHDTPVAHLSVTRLMMALFALAFTLYMIPGLWGAPVELLSGIAPPLGYSEWIHEESSGRTSADNSGANEKAHKYKDIFLTTKTHGLDLYYDYDEALAYARKEKKPLMVDFTGWACSNCRRMEDNVWSDHSILPKLKNEFVIVSLYVDEKHDLDSKEKYTSAYDGTKISTIGDKWKDMEMSKFEANSQPFYVLLDNNENKIGQYDGYDPDVSKFLGFLNDGQSKFKSQSTASLK